MNKLFLLQLFHHINKTGCGRTFDYPELFRKYNSWGIFTGLLAHVRVFIRFGLHTRGYHGIWT